MGFNLRWNLPYASGVWKDMRRMLTLFLAGIALSGWAQTGWPNYGNDAGGTRYSAARQIDRTNVAN